MPAAAAVAGPPTPHFLLDMSCRAHGACVSLLLHASCAPVSLALPSSCTALAPRPPGMCSCLVSHLQYLPAQRRCVVLHDALALLRPVPQRGGLRVVDAASWREVGRPLRDVLDGYELAAVAAVGDGGAEFVAGSVKLSGAVRWVVAAGGAAAGTSARPSARGRACKPASPQRALCASRPCR